MAIPDNSVEESFEDIRNDPSLMPNSETPFDEETNIPDIPEADVDEEDDPELIRILLARELAHQLFVNSEAKDKQISRLTRHDIHILSLMGFYDKTLKVPLYHNYATEFRTHMISLHGGARREVIDLVKASMGSMGNEGSGDMMEKRSWWGRIKNRLFE